MEAAGFQTAAGGYAVDRPPTALPELAAVPWRPRASAATLRRRGVWWTVVTTVHVVPFLIVAVVVLVMSPLLVPVALVALVHAWVIPELYAHRGANTVRPRKRDARDPAEPVAQGLLGDLLGHRERDIQRATGLALERGELGVWAVGEAGCLLVVPGGRRVHTFCVSTTDPELPPSDRIAHLVLALRADECGFATVANHAFSGAPWRLSRRMEETARPALRAARELARTG
jgi:hypothetical protein